MAIDVDGLWDFAHPELSEQAFTSALAAADPDEQLVLHTQIARTHGLRRNFDAARAVLAGIEQRVQAASAEAQVRYALELGRTYASPAHRPEELTPDHLGAARASYMRAYELAAAARLDALAIDALHMMPCVDRDPAEQLAWNERALAYVEASQQEQAKVWEASLRNNVGYAKHLAGHYDEALEQFRLSRAAHQRRGRSRDVRIADWMIAWTYRAQRRYHEALEIQLGLEQAWDADGAPDPYVYEELEHLYRALGSEERAEHYAGRFAAATPAP